MTLQALAQKPETLTDTVYRTILDAIIDKLLPPGCLTTESALAKQLDVSKTPVREALLRLREAHIIQPDSAGRLRVVEPSREAIRIAYERRMVLEPGLAYLAARSATDRDRTAILDLATRSLNAVQSGQFGEFRRLDRDFHMAIAEMTRNPILVDQESETLVLVEVLRSRDFPGAESTEGCAGIHVDIAESIAARDSAKASEHALEHVVKAMEKAIATYVDGHEGGGGTDRTGRRSTTV